MLVAAAFSCCQTAAAADADAVDGDVSSEGRPNWHCTGTFLLLFVQRVCVCVCVCVCMRNIKMKIMATVHGSAADDD